MQADPQRQTILRRIRGFHISAPNAEAILRGAERAGMTLEEIGKAIEDATAANDNRDGLKARIGRMVRDRADLICERPRRPQLPARPRPRENAPKVPAAVMRHRAAFSDALLAEIARVDASPMTDAQRGEAVRELVETWGRDNPEPVGGPA